MALADGSFILAGMVPTGHFMQGIRAKFCPWGGNFALNETQGEVSLPKKK